MRAEPGVYMELSSPNALRALMEYNGLRDPEDPRPGAGAAALAELCGTSRQFIEMLLKNKKKSCTPRLAARMEAVLLGPPERRLPTLPPLFVPRRSDIVGILSGTVGGRVQTPK